MRSEEPDGPGKGESRSGIVSISPREALRLSGRSIEVPDDTETELSPSRGEFAGCFASVRVGTFDDLQVLGLVPRRMDEDKIRRALAADDDAAMALARTAPPRTACDCHQGEIRGAAAIRRSFRGSYQNIRRHHHPALASAFSAHLGTAVGWDSPILSAARSWVVGLRVPRDILVAVFQDITIGKDSTLHVVPSAKSLFARDIWIHRNGTVRQRGSYLKIWASSIRSFSDLGNISITADARSHIPWALQD